MNKIYEKALEAYTAKQAKEQEAETKKKTLLQKAKEAITTASAAMNAAIRNEDRAAYKKALEAKNDAEGDATYYESLLSVRSEIKETDKEKYRSLYGEIKAERMRKMAEYEAMLFTKFEDLYKIAIESRAELNRLYWAEKAFEIEILKQGTSYDPYGAGNTKAYRPIYAAAQQIGAGDAVKVEALTNIYNTIEEENKIERKKWGSIGGNPM